MGKGENANFFFWQCFLNSLSIFNTHLHLFRQRFYYETISLRLLIYEVGWLKVRENSVLYILNKIENATLLFFGQNSRKEFFLFLFFHFNPFPNKPWFLRVCDTSLLKTLWEKEKLLAMNKFSFFPTMFLPVWRTFCHFHLIWNCCLHTLSVWKGLKFVVWERVK